MPARIDYAARARNRKVAEIVAHCRTHGLTADVMATSPEVRCGVVIRTGVREPSTETWRQVVTTLDVLERSDVRDPLTGL